MNHIFEQIKEERLRQNEKCGEQNYSPIEWIAILTEEVGEVAEMAAKYHFREPVKHPIREGHTIPATNLTLKARLIAYRNELIQVAAVAVQMIESFDRNEGTHFP